MIVTISVLAVMFLFCSATKDSNKMEPYVVGGSEVKLQRFPHSLYLYIICPVPTACGGSILTQDILLTAAHCFENCRQSDDITSYTGSENINKMTVSRRIISFMMHKQYSRITIHPDIALGLVDKPWRLSKLKRVMITHHYKPVNQAETAGWGMVNDDTGETRETLRAVIQNIKPPYVCSRTGNPILSGMICTLNHGNHPSSGDSGSALVINNGHQIGTVSWRSKRIKGLVVYTNITYYYDWIQQQSARLKCRHD